MERRVFRVVSFVVVMTAVTLCISNGRAQSGGAQHTATSHPENAATMKTAEQEFKNIQVLKGVPAEQLFPTMQFISASLGVECEFCHVEKAFEKDDKKTKQTARKMMEMMFAINKDNFEGHREVTCNTCHRGKADPVAIPAVMTPEEEQAIEADHPASPAAGNEEVKQNAGPTGEQLIENYVQALGGASAIDNVTSRVMKGKIEFGGKSFPIDIYCKHPEQRVSYTHNPNGDSITAFNGHEGWMKNPGMPLREMHAGDLDGAAIDADLHLATDLKQIFTQSRVRGTEKIDDHDAYVVVGRREGKTPIRLYFDKDSGLLLRLVRYGETALGWMPVQIDFADYRPVKGVKLPYRWTLARPGGRFTIQVSEVEQNVPIDDAKFVKPPAPPQESPKGSTR
jgi:photosynthetic reaction center cytochrome c subunit